MARSRSRPPAYNPSPPKVSNLNLAIIGVVFAIGIGLGIAFSAVANFSPKNVVSRDAIDRVAPNPEICAQYGASAIAMDTRIFVTLNPFNVYVSQPSMQPGCVLRTNNWAVLERRNLLNAEQVRGCKNRMNTFGYTRDLDADPEINCVYKNNRAENLFRNQPGLAPPPEGSDRF